MNLFSTYIATIFIAIVASAIDTSNISRLVHWLAVSGRTILIVLLAIGIVGDTACILTAMVSMFGLFGLLYRLGFQFFSWMHALGGAPAIYDGLWLRLYEALPTWLATVMSSPRHMAIAFEATCFFVGGVAYLLHAC